jgi:hypothetical protein
LVSHSCDNLALPRACRHQALPWPLTKEILPAGAIRKQPHFVWDIRRKATGELDQ